MNSQKSIKKIAQSYYKFEGTFDITKNSILQDCEIAKYESKEISEALYQETCKLINFYWRVTICQNEFASIPRWDKEGQNLSLENLFVYVDSMREVFWKIETSNY